MSRMIKTTIIATVGMLSGFALDAYSQDRQILSGSSSGSRNAIVKKFSPYRVSDRGNVLHAWRNQVVYRAVNNTNVYQHRSNPTARHDEVSGYAILFHTRGRSTGVKGGHVYHNRGN